MSRKGGEKVISFVEIPSFFFLVQTSPSSSESPLDLDVNYLQTYEVRTRVPLLTTRYDLCRRPSSFQSPLKVFVPGFQSASSPSHVLSSREGYLLVESLCPSKDGPDSIFYVDLESRNGTGLVGSPSKTPGSLVGHR